MELIGSSDNTNVMYIEKRRTSNFELLRIILMILIIAHQYVVNSGLFEAIRLSGEFTFKNIIILLIGGYGKIAINIFVLITGYFMCKNKFSLMKWFKLLMEVLFYKIVIYFIFLSFGYESFDVKSLFKTIFIFYNLSDNFTACFLVFYLFIPFISILVNNIDKKIHLLLIGLSLIVFSLIPSVPKFNVSSNYVIWFTVLFFISSYIRLYPNKLFDSIKITGIATLILIVISLLSIVASWFVLCKYDIKFSAYFFVSDSYKVLALLTSLSIFLFVKNINLSYNVVINTIAKATFGVFLIHSNSDTMRKWLWKDFLDNVGHYQTNDIYWHIVACTLGVYFACVSIDLIRIYCIENPLMKFINKKKENKQNTNSNL